MLRDLGHQVRVVDSAADRAGTWGDLLIAVHARKSARAVLRRDKALGPTILLLAGTDIYQDLPRSRPAQRAIASADRLVALQSRAALRLPARLRSRVRVIYQAATPIRPRPQAIRTALEIALLANIRPVKDPLRPAYATRGLAAASRIRVVHVGAVLDERLALRVARESAANRRYEFRGPKPPGAARRLLARASAVCVPSRLEGGANVVSEALACGVPLLASRIDGNVGILGDSYAGYFPAGNTAALTALMQSFEADAGFRRKLRAQCRRLARLVTPARERAAWRRLIGELC